MSSLTPAPAAAVVRTVVRVDAGGRREVEDALAVEEPLEIILGFGAAGERRRETLSITMRTPGDDLDLVAGFLFTEGLIRSAADIRELRHAGPPAAPGGDANVVLAELEPSVAIDLERLRRHFYTSSSCGVCGKTSLEAVETAAGAARLEDGFRILSDVLMRLPQIHREAQSTFGTTGGLHGAALFSADGRLISAREDVGRHNALDKLIGAQLLGGTLPLTDRVIMLSGRASFELLQKALMAGAPVVAAVGAPSSLAAELSERAGITLVGWLREGRFSIFSNPERILPPGSLNDED